MPARSVCLVTLSLSEAGPGRFGGQVSVTGIYHTIPPYQFSSGPVRAASHVHLVVAELCCGTPCQLPAERWELAGKTQRQSSVKISAIVKSCQSLKKKLYIYISQRS